MRDNEQMARSVDDGSHMIEPKNAKEASASYHDRMYCYLWYEKTNPDECKFGERYVPAGKDPSREVWKRIKDSVGVRKDLIKDGTIVLERTWDVSEYARKVDRFYRHGKVDDHIRPHIGFRKNTTGEIHGLPAGEVAVKVDRFLAAMGQPLPVAGLAAWQARSTEDILEAIGDGKRTIVAELCPRFGKTIWTGALARESGRRLTIVASYVLTSFSSFENDLSRFDQFKDMVLVDMSNGEHAKIIDSALASGKQVVAFLSMCAGGKRQRKIDYLFGLDAKRLLVIDEADFGAHKAAQSKPLISARDPDDVVVLMTGTNADKAIGTWHVDHMLSVVYPELLMEKRNRRPGHPTSLRFFKIDPSRHDLVVDVEFYQMDLRSAVELARDSDPDMFVKDGIFLPSWSKFAAHPVKAKGFWTRMLQAVFMGQHGLDELNVDYQTNRRAKEGQRVAMMFLSGSMTNDNLTEAAALAQQALPGYHVVPVYGEAMTNRTAEQKVREEIARAKQRGQSVLLLSAGMASRSFSRGEITELYLAYDNGDNGATMQKIARTLTPDMLGKVGRVISLSFDPNRDDKFDSMLIETVINYKNSREMRSAKDALRDVLRTVDIFRCTSDGSVKIEADTYLEEALARNSISRVIGKVADITKLTPAELLALSEGNIDKFKAALRETADKGKTRDGSAVAGDGGTGGDMPDITEDIIADVKRIIATIVENLDIIVLGTNTTEINDAFDVLESNHEMRRAVIEEFGVDFSIIRDLFDRGVINQDLLELQLDVSNKGAA